MFYGSIIFRFVGTLARWTIVNFILFFRKNVPYRSFASVRKGPEIATDDDPVDGVSYKTSNILIGFAVLMILYVAIIKFGW